MGQQDQDMRESMRDQNGNTITHMTQVSKSSKGVFHKMGKITNPSQWNSRTRKPPGSFSPNLNLKSAGGTPISDLQTMGRTPNGGVMATSTTSLSVAQRGPQGVNGIKPAVPRKSLSGPDPNPYASPIDPMARSGANSNGQGFVPMGPYLPVPLRGGSQPAVTAPAPAQNKTWQAGPDILPHVDVDGGLFLDPSEDARTSIDEDGRTGHGDRAYINLGIANSVGQPEFVVDHNLTGGYSRGDGPPRRNNTWEEPSTRIHGAPTRNPATASVVVPVPHNLQAENERLREALRRAQEDKGEADRRVQKLTNNSLAAVQDGRQWEAMQRELDVARAKLEQFDTMLRTETDQHAQSKDNLQEAQSNYEALQTSMDALQDQLKWLKVEHESLKVDHDSANADRQDLMAAQEECLQTIDRLRGDFGPHLDDEYFKECYDKLRRDIERWSVDYFKGPISALPSPGAALMEVSDDCDEYLQSQLMRPKLVQSYVWSVLNTKVFACNSRNNPGFWWAHSRRNQFSGLVALLQPNEAQRLRPREQDEKAIREYHRWRAMTTRLLESKIKYPEIARTEKFDDDIIDSTLNALKAIRSDDGRQKSHTDGAYTRKVYEIFYQAIIMDHEMNKQFAFYTIEMPALHVRDHNQVLINSMFDPNTMEVDSAMIRADGSVECRSVGLVMTPMLLVCGSKDGDGFVSPPRVLVPSVVMPLGGLSHRQHEDPRRGRRGSDAAHQGGIRQGSQQRQLSQKPKSSSKWLFSS